MILRFFNWLFSLFGYELIHWKEKAELGKTILSYKELIFSTKHYPYTIEWTDGGFQVLRKGFNGGAIYIKVFTVKDYGSVEYAHACAYELAEMLNAIP